MDGDISDTISHIPIFPTFQIIKFNLNRVTR